MKTANYSIYLTCIALSISSQVAAQGLFERMNPQSTLREITCDATAFDGGEESRWKLELFGYRFLFDQEYVSTFFDGLGSSNDIFMMWFSTPDDRNDGFMISVTHGPDVRGLGSYSTWKEVISMALDKEKSANNFTNKESWIIERYWPVLFARVGDSAIVKGDMFDDFIFVEKTNLTYNEEYTNVILPKVGSSLVTEIKFPYSFGCLNIERTIVESDLPEFTWAPALREFIEYYAVSGDVSYEHVRPLFPNEERFTRFLEKRGYRKIDE
ncbi:MAG: hypothetical protein R3332_04425 [Pseudohongiellaceae bacterium]|nr:hypothetical protein [Pseudohongiellaceae bacterium]